MATLVLKVMFWGLFATVLACVEIEAEGKTVTMAVEKGLADLAIVVPSQKTARIQESHILIGHIICERVDEIL